MKIEHLIQYIGIAVFLLAFVILLFVRRDIKKFIPVGLFSTIYANIWCYLADYLKLWGYPTRLFPKFTIVSIPFNYTALPTLVIVWLIFCPSTKKGKIFWAVGWSAVLVSIEFVITRFTTLLKYTNGFDIHVSFVLWLISWYIFLKFHQWINSKK